MTTGTTLNVRLIQATTPWAGYLTAVLEDGREIPLFRASEEKGYHPPYGYEVVRDIVVCRRGVAHGGHGTTLKVTMLPLDREVPVVWNSPDPSWSNWGVTKCWKILVPSRNADGDYIAEDEAWTPEFEV